MLCILSDMSISPFTFYLLYLIFLISFPFSSQKNFLQLSLAFCIPVFNIKTELNISDPGYNNDEENSTPEYSTRDLDSISTTNDKELIKNCKYCDPNYSRMITLERRVYCFGIWLHALKYSGHNWGFETKYPEWANIFIQNNS